MDLQTVFYTIGIISMVLWIVILATVLAIIWKIRDAVQHFKSSFRNNVVGLIKEKNVEVASALGLTVAHFVIDKIKQNRSRSKKSSDNE